MVEWTNTYCNDDRIQGMGTNTRAAARSKFTTNVHDKVHRGWDEQVVVASGTAFLSAYRFPCLLIFWFSIHRNFKGVVLAKRRLDKFYWFFWIVVYIRIEVQLNLHLCANYLGGKYWGCIFMVANESTWEASSRSPDGVLRRISFWWIGGALLEYGTLVPAR